jgi:hypothetical protein
MCAILSDVWVSDTWSIIRPHARHVIMGREQELWDVRPPGGTLGVIGRPLESYIDAGEI